MIIITTSLVNLFSDKWAGCSFLIFILVAPRLTPYQRTIVIQHEKVHFKQQLEMLFVPMWLLYLTFLAVYGYERNPFEREAEGFQERPASERRWYGWTKYT